MMDGADIGSQSQVQMTTVSPILLPPFPGEGGMGAQSVRAVAQDLWAPCSQFSLDTFARCLPFQLSGEAVHMCGLCL